MPNAAGTIPPQLRRNWVTRIYPDAPLLDRYKREYVDFHQLTEKEWKARQRVLHAFMEFVEDGDLTNMTAPALLAYAGSRLDDGRHINTVRFEMNRVRWLASWLYANKLITADQLLEIRAVRDPRGSTGRAVPRPYSREELDTYYSIINERWPLIEDRVNNAVGVIHLHRLSIDRWVVTGHGWVHVRRHAMRLQIEAITALALHCALRAKEIWSLDTKQLWADPRYLVVKTKRTDNRDKVREVPYTTPTRDAVRAWLTMREKMSAKGQRPWLKLSNRGSALAPMTLHDMHTFLTRNVGPEWHLHRFRHTAATERLRAGADIDLISKWLGHSNRLMTLGYLDIVKNDIADALEQTEDRFVERISERTTNDSQENGDGPDKADV